MAHNMLWPSFSWLPLPPCANPFLAPRWRDLLLSGPMSQHSGGGGATGDDGNAATMSGMDGTLEFGEPLPLPLSELAELHHQRMMRRSGSIPGSRSGSAPGHADGGARAIGGLDADLSSSESSVSSQSDSDEELEIEHHLMSGPPPVMTPTEGVVVIGQGGSQGGAHQRASQGGSQGQQIGESVRSEPLVAPPQQLDSSEVSENLAGNREGLITGGHAGSQGGGTREALSSSSSFVGGAQSHRVGSGGGGAGAGTGSGGGGMIVTTASAAPTVHQTERKRSYSSDGFSDEFGGPAYAFAPSGGTAAEGGSAVALPILSGGGGGGGGVQRTGSAAMHCSLSSSSSRRSSVVSDLDLDLDPSEVAGVGSFNRNLASAGNQKSDPPPSLLPAPAAIVTVSPLDNVTATGSRENTFLGGEKGEASGWTGGLLLGPGSDSDNSSSFESEDSFGQPRSKQERGSRHPAQAALAAAPAAPLGTPAPPNPAPPSGGPVANPEGLDRHTASGSMTAPPQAAAPPAVTATAVAAADGGAGVHQRPSAPSDDEFDYFDDPSSPPSSQPSTSVQPAAAVQPVQLPNATPIAETPTAPPQQQLLESIDDEFDSDWDVGEV